MKHHLLTLILCLVSFSASAEWYNEYTFVVGKDVCGPITVRYAGRNYTVYNSFTLKFTGSTSTPSATDCNGRDLKYEATYRTQNRGSDTYHYNTYVFLNRTSYENNSSRSNGSSNNSAFDYSEIGSNIGRGLAEASALRSLNESGGAYPGLHAGIGISKAFGEFLRVRLAAGGFQIYTGIGKDWIFNGDNKKKFLWHAGLGGYMSLGYDDIRWGDISYGLTVAENAAWKNLSLTFDFNFTYWFDRRKRFGAFVGTGVGWGNLKSVTQKGEHTKCAWNVEVGAAFCIVCFD